MDLDWDPAFQPSISKACSRCHARKVKCDLKVPQCSACVKHDEECNITECVAYPYAVIKRLLIENKDLRQRLEAARLSAAQASITQHPTSAPNNWPGVHGKEAEEVGVLAIGGPSLYSDTKYVGSAAGSTFARIFFKQLNLDHSDVSSQQGSSLDQCPSKRLAALPPPTTARLLLRKYIARVHTWWPFLQLPILRRAFEAVYQRPNKASDEDKSMVFGVLALASSECQDDKEYQNAMDVNTPISYFQTGLRFFTDFHDHPRDLFGIQAVMLLTLWMLNSSLSSHCNDLWHLSRYIMSAAVEAGLHRHNGDWGFSAEELETRNRTWWCAYNLERHAAVITGRVLSIRDHAVHALQPTRQSFDALNSPEASIASVYHAHDVLPFRLMIRLRQISGRILESIYIGRGPDGNALNTSFQRICAMSDELRQDLEIWRNDLNAVNFKPSREYSELKIEYCLLQLLLNRPSPTFMVPSVPMIGACSKAVSSAVRQWLKIEHEYGLSAVCRCFRQLHAILLVGLAGLYCDWKTMIMAPDLGDEHLRQTCRHLNDTNACLGLIRRSISNMEISGLSKYQHLLQSVKNKVYAKSPVDVLPGPIIQTPAASFFSGGDSYDSFSPEGLDLNASSGLMFAGQQDMEVYRSHVSGFFDGGMVEMDETLNTWYEAIMRDG